MNLPGKIVLKPCSIHYSNVMLIDPTNGYAITYFSSEIDFFFLSENQPKLQEDILKMERKFVYLKLVVILFLNLSLRKRFIANVSDYFLLTFLM